MSAKAALVLGLGLGVIAAGPLIGVVTAFTADRICDWHYKKNGMREWARRNWGKS